MEQLEGKLGAILGNPEMMQKIMAMAQQFQQEAPQEAPKPPEAPDLPDPAMLQTLMGFAQQAGVDKNQQNLLQALGPYLSKNRLSKLERAMQAAKMAGMATALLPNLIPGR